MLPVNIPAKNSKIEKTIFRIKAIKSLFSFFILPPLDKRNIILYNIFDIVHIVLY
jgi:hypothetical protein